MNRKLISGLFLVLFLSGCGGFITNTTVNDVTTPPARTLETKIKSEQVADSSGSHIGQYMKRLASQIKTSDSITMVTYDQGLRIILNSELLFAGPAHTIRAAPKTLEVFNTLKESKYAEFLVEVHTDGEGSRYYNQSLSERRAESLKTLLHELNFSLDRTQIKAYGEDQPIADNSFGWGKFLNRRIEIGVFASDKLKEMATKGSVH